MKTFSGPPTTSQKNENKDFFRDTKKGKWMWKEMFMTQTINQIGQPLSMGKRDDFVLVYLRYKVEKMVR